MTEVIGVRFRKGGKSYYFSPGKERLEKGDLVVVETARGTECGEVYKSNHMVQDDDVVKPLKEIIRRATRHDEEMLEENREKEKNAAVIFDEKVAEHGLDMKLVGVECAFDRSKIVFYYTAPSRVDFRTLVKDLAGIFKARIELRQIGVRDEAKMLGGLGICGRCFCCKSFLSDFQPVTIKMAKEQGLSLNTSKINGVCGRLMCCLKYEQSTYEQLLKTMPKVGTPVQTKDGRGVVTGVDILGEKVTVKTENDETSVKTYFVRDVRIQRTRGKYEVPSGETDAEEDE